MVGIANDPDAYLGLDGYADSTKTPTLTNNSSYSMSITLSSPDSVEFDVGTDGNWATPPVTFSLASGASTEVNIRTDGCAGGTASVAASADLLDGGTSVGAIDLTRTWEIPQSGQFEVTGNVRAVGNSGNYEFELTNDGCVDVTITGIGINETTNPDAVKVGGKNGDSILLQNGVSIVSSVIPVDSSDPGSATVVGFDAPVDLAQNQTKPFEFDPFRDAGDKKAKMKGDDVKVTLQFSDGSTAVANLCVDGCSF